MKIPPSDSTTVRERNRFAKHMKTDKVLYSPIIGRISIALICLGEPAEIQRRQAVCMDLRATIFLKGVTVPLLYLAAPPNSCLFKYLARTLLINLSGSYWSSFYLYEVFMATISSNLVSPSLSG